MADVVNLGDYIVIKRQNYKKLHKIQPGVTVRLGKNQIDVANCISHPFNSTFKQEKSRNNIYILTKVEQAKKLELPPIESGEDNRHIRADGSSQKLTTDQIQELQTQDLTANELIETIVSNSTTFSLKTQYSQEKYIKKKEKKYYEYVQVIKPTIMDLIDIYYRLNPAKILGLRMDDIAQILFYSNVHCYGNHLIYESGTCGLVVAAMMERIGGNTPGQLIHIHPGNEPQKQALTAMQYPDEQMNRYVNVNIYSILRHYHQKHKKYPEENIEKPEAIKQDEQSEEPEPKKPKLESIELESEESEPKKRKRDFKQSEPKKQKQESEEALRKWEEENKRVCEIFDSDKCDSFIVIAKENPNTIIDAFLDFVNLGRPIVIFSESVETLTDVYMHLKMGKRVTNLILTNNFMREIQVLPSRTHPNVNRDFGGYILFGYVVSTTETNISLGDGIDKKE